MRFSPVLLALLAGPALALEPPLRPSARLLLKEPAPLAPGQCVIYQEGGSGWVVTEPVYYLQGRVLASEVRTRHLGQCPLVAARSVEHYSRQEFIRLAQAYPCVGENVPARDEQIGIVRLRVESWETPYARKAASAGRLYRGTFIEQRLEKDMEIELEADLLRQCAE